MNYSITPILHNHEDKKGLHKVMFLVIYNRMRVYLPTVIKIPVDNFENGLVVKHQLKRDFNGLIKENSHDIEKRLMEALRSNQALTKEQLEQIVKGKEIKKTASIEDFIYDQVDLLKGKFSDGRLKHYKVIANKIAEFKPGATFTEIDVEWLNRFEKWLRSQKGREGQPLDGNTVQSNMKLIKTILQKAKVAGLIKKEQFEYYTTPKYSKKIPEYLTEVEMEKLYNFLQLVEKPTEKLSGYYFLLGCYAGYRISDLKKFDYDEMVRGDRIRLRAKKNGEIVSMYIHGRLQKVLDYIKDKPLTHTEERMRDHVKSLASFIGIARKIKIHTARHSFGMLLAENGFDRDEAAELMGDSLAVVSVYFRMTNKRIDKKVKERLG